MFNKNNQNNQNAAPEVVKSYLNIAGATIQAAHLISDNVAVFTLNVPGATFRNLKVVQGTNGMFIAMPQTKGKNDQWYDQYRVYLSDDDQKRVIDAVGANCVYKGEKIDFKTRYEVK